MTNLGLIGVGKWGSRYLDTIALMTDVRVTALCRKSIQPPVNTPNDCAFFTDWETMLDIVKSTNMCDGIIIATPPDTHMAIATEAVKMGLGVMIEKPAALSTKEIIELDKIKTKVPILVNHTHLFAPAYEKLKRVINSPITSLQTCGWNCGPVRSYSSLYDYSPHDLAMCIDLMGSAPSLVSVDRNITEYGEIYNLILRFGKAPAVIRIGNGGREKRRLFQVFCERDVYEYDDTKPRSKKLTKSMNSYSKSEDIYIDEAPSLYSAIRAFVSSLNGRIDGRCGLSLAIQVSKVIDDCMKHLGYEI
jgi:predicted dehydrogenase